MAKRSTSNYKKRNLAIRLVLNHESVLRLSVSIFLNKNEDMITANKG